MNVTLEMKQGILIVRPEGELDVSTVGEFRQQVDEAIDRRQSKDLLLNLEKVTFLDSSGVGVILGRYKKMRFWGGKVIVTDVTQPVARLFELAGLSKILVSYSTEEQALKAL